jgi:transposase
MRRENVAEERLPQLEAALRHNEPLSLGYLLKEALGLLWEPPSRAPMERFLQEWCQWARDSGVRQMQSVAQTLQLHARGILAGWNPRISHGRMEGINNKIRTLLRQTSGLRDERYLQLRLDSLHDSRLKLVG